MHSMTVGKRRYAFGLRWEELEPGRSAAALFKEHAGQGVSGLHVVITHADGRKMLGTVESPSKGVYYSAAQALAARGQDGIYVMPFNDRGSRALWYVVIEDGAVQAASDVVGAPDAIIAEVDAMRQVFDRPIYCTQLDEVAEVWEDAILFDLEAVLSEVKLKPLAPIGKSETGKIIAILLVFGTLGGFAWHALKPPAISDTQQLAEQAWQARRNYLASLRQSVKQPVDSGWIRSAFGQTRMFPPTVSGWFLNSTHCTIAHCVATYDATEKAARAIEPLKNQFSSLGLAVQMTDNQNVLSARLALDVPVQTWSDHQLLAPKAWARQALDVAGRAGLYFSDLTQGGPVTIKPVGNNRPHDASVLNEERIVLKQSQELDPERLNTLVAWFGQDGFVAHQARIKYMGRQDPRGSTEIEFVRYNGSIIE